MFSWIRHCVAEVCVLLSALLVLFYYVLILLGPSQVSALYYKKKEQKKESKFNVNGQWMCLGSAHVICQLTVAFDLN